MGSRKGPSGFGSIVTVIHLTPSTNVDSILKNGFDLSKAGSEGGDTWGNAIYFLSNKEESDFYSKNFGSQDGVVAKVDTSGMLKINFDGEVYGPSNMYKLAAEQLPDSIRQEYYNKLNNPSKKTTARVAFADVVSKHYPGIIIKHTGVNGVNGTTGGNQIVVYDTKVIKSIRRK